MQKTPNIENTVIIDNWWRETINLWYLNNVYFSCPKNKKNVSRIKTLKTRFHEKIKKNVKMFYIYDLMSSVMHR